MNPLLVNAGELNSIAHAIQLSVAPVFLLSGIGVLLTMLTNRLVRVVDRARPLEELLKTAAPADADTLGMRLAVFARRARLISRAITLSTLSALFVALVVVLLFAGEFVTFSLGWPVAVLFIASMLALTGALLAFLVEVQIATKSLRIGPRR